MTVIASDGVTVAADGLITADGEIVSNSDVKIFIHNKSIYGAAGTVESCIKFEKFVIAGTLNKKAKEIDWNDFDGIKVSRTGIMWYVNGVYPTLVDSPFAIGVGGSIAIGAMFAGATPYEAVEAAIRGNVYCGGKILELTL